MEFLESLVCPVDRTPLRREAETVLLSKTGRRYPIVGGVPVLLRPDRPDTLWVASASWEAAWKVVRGERTPDELFLDTIGFTPDEREAAQRRAAESSDSLDAVVNFIIGATNGYLYRHLIGDRLDAFPIPVFRLRGSGQRLLDVGCNWGRWVVSATRAGFTCVGIDPTLGGVLAARRLCQRLGIDADFVVGDARFLPFGEGSFDIVHSYSVLQHFPRADAYAAFAEAGRVLKPAGTSFIQMPNRLGIRCLYHQARRGFVEPQSFDVRYYSRRELRTLGELVGDTTLEVDGFFGLGVQASDRSFLDIKGRIVVDSSERLRATAVRFPQLSAAADSLYVRSRRKELR